MTQKKMAWSELTRSDKKMTSCRDILIVGPRTTIRIILWSKWANKSRMVSKMLCKSVKKWPSISSLWRNKMVQKYPILKKIKESMPLTISLKTQFRKIQKQTRAFIIQAGKRLTFRRSWIKKRRNFSLMIKLAKILMSSALNRWTTGNRLIRIVILSVLKRRSRISTRKLQKINLTRCWSPTKTYFSIPRIQDIKFSKIMKMLRKKKRKIMKSSLWKSWCTTLTLLCQKNLL